MPALQGASLQLVTLIAALLAWLTTSEKVSGYPQLKLILPFTLYASLTIGLAGWWGGTVVALNSLLPASLLAILVANAARNEKHLRAIILATVLCACILVYHGHQQYTTGTGYTGARLRDGRIYYVGILSDPNDLGMLFDICLAFSLSFLIYDNGMTRRLLMLATTAWLAYGVFLTQSRGAMLGALAAMGFLIWRKLGKVSAAVMLALIVPSIIAATRLSQLSSDEESAAGRVEAWYDGLQAFISRPLFGVGYGNITDYTSAGLTAHNSLVLVLTELGFPGLMLWIALIYFSIISLYYINHSSTEANRAAREEEFGIDKGLMAACIAFAVCAFFLSQSYKPFFFLLIGLAVARHSMLERVGMASRSSVATSVHVQRIAGLSLSVVITFWLLVRILL